VYIAGVEAGAEIGPKSGSTVAGAIAPHAAKIDATAIKLKARDASRSRALHPRERVAAGRPQGAGVTVITFRERWVRSMRAASQ
jgi:hypothetical protein